jgi:hypothetical protein
MNPSRFRSLSRFSKTSCAKDAANEVNNMIKESAKPVKKFVAGMIQVAVWRNALPIGGGNDGGMMTVALERRYKDREGNWQSSGSLRVNDVPKAILLLNKAYEFLTTSAEDGDGGDTNGQ